MFECKRLEVRAWVEPLTYSKNLQLKGSFKIGDLLFPIENIGCRKDGVRITIVHGGRERTYQYKYFQSFLKRLEKLVGMGKPVHMMIEEPLISMSFHLVNQLHLTIGESASIWLDKEP